MDAPANDGEGLCAFNVTTSKQRPIRSFAWAYTSRRILYLQDKGGDENYHLYSADLSSGEAIDLTPGDKLQAQLIMTSPKLPLEALVAVNDRLPQLHDLYCINVETGERRLVHKNTEGILFYHATDRFELRLARRMTADGGMEILGRNAEGAWSTFLKVPADDSMTTLPVGFDAEGKRAYIIDSVGRDTSAMTAVDLGTRSR